MLIKCTSVSSMDSDQSEGSRTGVLARAGTMSEGALLRKDKSRSDTRPKSEIPKGLHKEFESSFEVRKLIFFFFGGGGQAQCMFNQSSMEWNIHKGAFIQSYDFKIIL